MPVDFSSAMRDLNTFSNLDASSALNIKKGMFKAIHKPIIWLKKPDPTAIKEQVKQFSSDFIEHTESQLEKAKKADGTVKEKIFREQLTLHNQLKFAMHGKQAGGGLVGLAASMQEGNVVLQSIQAMWNTNTDTLRQLYDLLPTKPETQQEFQKQISAEKELTDKPVCPEEAYTQEEWSQAEDIGRLLQKEPISDLKMGKYKVSLFFNEVVKFLDEMRVKVVGVFGKKIDESFHWWDRIFTNGKGAQLFLGALPLKEGSIGRSGRNDLEAIKAQLGNNCAVLSVTEVFENTSDGLLTSAVTPEDWKKAGIKQLQLPTPDFETIPIETICRGVEFISENLEAGRSVYVHCKAGRARSALIEMCYLIKYQGMNPDEAYKQITDNRMQAGFLPKSRKWASLELFYQMYGSDETKKARPVQQEKIDRLKK